MTHSVQLLFFLRRAGGGVLQDEAQWQEVAVASPHVQWHRHFRQQVRLPAELLSG